MGSAVDGGATGGGDVGSFSGGAGAAGSGAGGSGASDGKDGNYYVAVDGNDSNPGTLTEPFANLQKAIDVAKPGELVYVRGGLYKIVTGATPGAGVVFNKSGSSESERIRYFAYQERSRSSTSRN